MADWDIHDASNPLNYLQPAAANPFDQFDAHDVSLSPRFANVYGRGAQVQRQAAPAPQANPFDQFDGQQAPAGNDGTAGSFVRGLVNGATFNMADPAVAAIQATVGDPTNPTSHADDWASRYHENLAALRHVGMADHIAHPIAAYGGDFMGSLANPANRLIGSVNGIRSAATAGARLGLGYGIGSGITDDQGIGGVIDEGAKGAVFGGATGGALHGIGSMVSEALQPRVAPTITALKDAARAAYDRLDNSGVLVGSDALNAMGDSALDKFATRLDPALHPKATAALNRVAAFATDGRLGDRSALFNDLDTLRRVVADAAQSIEPSDKYMARQILDHVDNFVDRLGPQHLDTGNLDAARSAVTSATGQKGAISRAISGIEQNQSGALAARGAAGAGTRSRYMQLRQDLVDAEDARSGALQQFNDESSQLATGAQSAVNDLQSARNYWKRAAKAQTLQGIIDKAKLNSTGFSQSGYENALRSGFRRLANNDRGMARFTPDEKAAIVRVATGGGKLSPTNVMRQVGKLSPHGAIPILSEIGLHAAIGPQALAVPALGIAARAGATALQKGAANRAVDLAAIGPRGSAALQSAGLPASLLRLQAIEAAKSLPKLTPGAIAVSAPAWQ